MELINFLKKYSTIPGDFIDDFHKLIYNNNEEFKINLDIAVKWLGVRKDSLKRTLLTYYNNDKKTHFIIKKKYDGTPGKPDETIMLSTDCFKRLCMRSESPKAEEVRSYYIQLEKLVDKYKNHIIYSMEQKIKQLENNQKPIVNYKSGVIYVFKTDQTIEDLYKVGKSDNFKQRMNSHNSSHADNVELVFVYETNNVDQVESCIKLALKEYQYRKIKEIYQVDLDLIKKVTEMCDNLYLVAKRKSKKFKNKGGYYCMIQPDFDYSE